MSYSYIYYSDSYSPYRPNYNNYGGASGYPSSIPTYPPYPYNTYTNSPTLNRMPETNYYYYQQQQVSKLLFVLCLVQDYLSLSWIYFCSFFCILALWSDHDLLWSSPQVVLNCIIRLSPNFETRMHCDFIWYFVISFGIHHSKMAPYIYGK